MNSDSFSPSLDSLPLLDVTSDLEEFFRNYKNKTHLYDQSTDEPDLKVDDLPLPYYENYQKKKTEHEESDDEVESELSNLFHTTMNYLRMRLIKLVMNRSNKREVQLN